MHHHAKWSGVVLVGLLAAGTGSAFGQDTKKETTAASMRPSELFACKYREGKGMADLQKAAAAFNAWLDSTNQHDYWAFLLTPWYRSKEQDFDVLWAGGWPTGAAMGRGLQRWFGEGGAAAAEFDKAVRCDSATNFAILDLSAAPNSPDSGPVTFSNCTVKEGRKFPDALAAVNTWLAYEKEHGITSNNFLLFPAFGQESTASYTFKWVTTSSWEAFGKSYDQYGTGGGWRTAEELFGGLLKCDSGRVYVSQRVRRAAPAPAK